MLKNFKFEKIDPTDEQILTLHDLLNKRAHKISHDKSVSFERHESFVKNHPYRAWYLVASKSVVIGSFYISCDNTIGINVIANNDESLITAIILYVKSNFEPLDAIPSVRAGRFAINVPPSNNALTVTLRKLGADLAQSTYYLP